MPVVKLVQEPGTKETSILEHMQVGTRIAQTHSKCVRFLG